MGDIAEDGGSRMGEMEDGGVSGGWGRKRRMGEIAEDEEDSGGWGR